MNHLFLLAQKQLDNGMAKTATDMQYHLDADLYSGDYAKKLAESAFAIADAMFAEEEKTSDENKE